MRKLVLHIGYPKACSTTLQRQVFPFIRGFRYLGKDDGLSDQHLYPLLFFFRGLAFELDKRLDYVFREAQSFIEREEERRYGNIDISVPLLISHESFLAELFKPRNLGFITRCADLEDMLERLVQFGRTANFDIHIIFINREKKDLIHSWYAEYYYHFMNFASTKTLKNYLKTGLNSKGIDLGFKWYEGSLVKDSLEKHLPKERIFIVHMNELISGCGENMVRIRSLLGSDISIADRNIENKRQNNEKIKLANLKHRTESNQSFWRSCLVALEHFKSNYISKDRLIKHIEWDQECDELIGNIR